MATISIGLLLLLAAPPVDSADLGGGYAPPTTETAPLVPLRTGAELAEAARQTLRRLARPTDQEAAPAAREFLFLYEELQRDTQMARASREQLRNKVRGRLAALAQQISKNLAIEKRRAQADRPNSVAGAEQQRPLAQWGGGFAQQPATGGVGAPAFFGRGPGAFGGGMGDNDAGEQLVELIQATIAPTTWDVNGGPGSIYYWKPGRSLVVRAGQEVHEDLGNLMEQLRRAGN